MDLGCRGCRLSETRTRVVAGDGPTKSKIMFVGEAPGRDEDISGKPFVGRAGAVLAGALHDLGVTRHDVFITNTVKCRPPGNRRPKEDEVQACRRHLEAELDEVGPELVCILGLTAARGLLGEDSAMSELLGAERTITVGGMEYVAIVNYHPAACLYRRENMDAFKGVIRTCLEKVGMA